MMKNKNIRIRLSVILTFCLILSIAGYSQPVTNSAGTAAKSLKSLSVSDTSVQTGAGRRASGTQAEPHENGVFGHVTVNDLRSASGSVRKSNSAAQKNKSDASAAYSHKEATSTAEPFYDRELTAFGTILSEQMLAAMGRTTGTAAVISNITSTELASINAQLNAGSSGTLYNLVDLRSKIDFRIPTNRLPAKVLASGSPSDVLYYLEQSIAMYPSLCCLFTLAHLTITGQTATLTVYSPVARENIASTTLNYEARLNELLRTPNRDSSMTVTDKILYLHDEIVALGEYATGRSGSYSIDYCPIGVALYECGVCQSYAAVFNHAARAMGITSYVVDSSSHAWNAVYINNAWYYVDTTWDDTRSYGQEKDYIRHDYLLVNESAFTSSHTLTSEYTEHFPGLTNTMGNSFDTYYPKKNKITSQMGYLGGYFYFSEDNKVKRWDRGTRVETFDRIPVVSSRRVCAMDGLLYVSGSDGMYQSDAALTMLNPVSATPFTGMYEAANRLFVSTGTDFYIFHSVTSQTPSSTTGPVTSLSPLITPTPYNPYATPGRTTTPVPTQTPFSNIPTVPPRASGSPRPSSSPAATNLPGIPIGTAIPLTSASPSVTVNPTVTATPPSGEPDAVVTIKTPAQTSIKDIKNVKTRAVKLKWKQIKNISKYQVQYSPTSDFSTKQMRNVLTNSVKIANLFKNKTYYFRVRAVRIQRGLDGIIYYKYGKWSDKRKKLITV